MDSGIVGSFAKASGSYLNALRDGSNYLVSYLVEQPQLIVCLLAALAYG